MILHSMGTAYYYLCEFKEAIKYTVQARSLFEEIGSAKYNKAKLDLVRMKIAYEEFDIESLRSSGIIGNQIIEACLKFGDIAV